MSIMLILTNFLLLYPPKASQALGYYCVQKGRNSGGEEEKDGENYNEDENEEGGEGIG